MERKKDELCVVIRRLQIDNKKTRNKHEIKTK
jgi:hypothetical protein